MIFIFNAAKLNQYRIRKIRDTLPSVPKLLEVLRRDPNTTALGTVQLATCV